MVGADTDEAAADTLNLRVAGAAPSAQRWRLQVEFEPTVPVLGGPTAHRLRAHRVKMGLRRVFEIPVPQPFLTHNLETGVLASGAKDDNRITFSPPVQWPTGLFMRFRGDPKVYMTTDDQGGVTPPLRQALNNAVIDTEPMMRVRYDPDDPASFGTDRRGTERSVRTFVEAI